MRNLFSALGLILSLNAFAVTPFTVSGMKLKAVFESEQLWKKLGGQLESAVYRGHRNGVSTFAVTTTEQVSVRDNSGVTVGSRSAPCLVLVDVVNKDPGNLAPEWEVSKVDFTACPLTMGK